MQIGPYRVLATLGQGGVGVVLRALAPTGQPVAIKVLLEANPKAVARFERELRLQRQLAQDAGFVPVVDAGQCERGPYVVMPLLGGGTLRDRLRGGRLADEEVLGLGIALARALAAAHLAGIVHRDLKPENVLFDDAGRPLVADLGLAKHFSKEGLGSSQSVALSRTGETLGTYGYMPPEQLTDAREAGPRPTCSRSGRSCSSA